jgi:hypothetical protein
MSNKEKILQLSKSKQGQLDYINAKYYGCVSSDMAVFFNEKLSDEAYQLVFDKYSINDYHDSRIYLTILSSNNTPKKWLQKFYEKYSQTDTYIWELKRNNIYSEKQVSKLAREKVYQTKSSIVLSKNIDSDLFNSLKEEQIIKIFLNTDKLSDDEAFDYLLKLNENKLTKAKHKEILSFVSGRSTKNEKLIDFIINNGTFIDIKNLILQTTNIITDFNLFYYLFDSILNHQNLYQQNKESLIKSLLSKVEEYQIPLNDDLETFLESNYSKIWNNFNKLKTAKKGKNNYNFKL